MFRNSIRARLVVGVLLVQFALALGVVSTGVYYTRRRLRSSMDATLQARAMNIAALVRFSESDSTKLIFDESLAAAAFNNQSNDFFELHTSDGALIAHSSNWNPSLQTDNFGHRKFWQLHVGGIRYRAVRLNNVPVLDREQNTPNPGTLTIFYAMPTRHMDEETWETAIFLSCVSLALTLLTGLIAWWAIRRTLEPLDELAGNASQITPNNWNLHVPESNETPDELKPLINAMENMLSNLESAFRQQRDFVADAAHELKTPIAILKSSLQSINQKQRSSQEYRQGIEEALDDIGRLERLVQQLLRLARAEQWSAGAIHRELEPINIAETCDRALLRLRGLAKDRQVVCELKTDGPLFLHADPDDLETVWSNLLENAIHYSPPGAKVIISVENLAQTRCRVVVADSGEGIPTEQLARVFERFHRGDPSRARATGGVGLGLAIVKALVEAYQGTITAESQTGAGTRMIVELPVEAPVSSSESLSLH
jgi:heavy metal sensor kinase